MYQYYTFAGNFDFDIIIVVTILFPFQNYFEKKTMQITMTQSIQFLNVALTEVIEEDCITLLLNQNMFMVRHPGIIKI